MKRTATLPIVFLIVASSNACVKTKVELLVPPGRYAPVAAEEVRVFMARAEIIELGYEYEPVGMLFTSGSADHTGQEDFLRSAREKAGEIGANGVILGEMDEPSFGERLFGGSQRRSQMMAIRWWLPEEHPESGLSYQDSLLAMAPDAGDLYTFPNSDNRYGYINRAFSALGLHTHSSRAEGDVLFVTFDEARLRLAVTRIDNEPVQIRIVSDDPELVAALLDALDEARAEQVSEN